MPAKRTHKRRVERCCYIEGGMRCRRSGTGDPSLCNPHRVVLSAAGNAPQPIGDGVKNLVDRFVNGRRVTRKVWEGALGDVATWVKHYGQQQQGHQQQQQRTGDGGFRPPPGFTPPPGWDFIPPWARPRQPPPPPPDPAVEECRRARIVLGFTPGEALTLEVIQKRRRELARKHHPDRGGSVAKMQAVNAAADALEARVNREP